MSLPRSTADLRPTCEKKEGEEEYTTRLSLPYLITPQLLLRTDSAVSNYTDDEDHELDTDTATSTSHATRSTASFSPFSTSTNDDNYYGDTLSTSTALAPTSTTTSTTTASSDSDTSRRNSHTSSPPTCKVASDDDDERNQVQRRSNTTSTSGSDDGGCLDDDGTYMFETSRRLFSKDLTASGRADQIWSASSFGIKCVSNGNNKRPVRSLFLTRRILDSSFIIANNNNNNGKRRQLHIVYTYASGFSSPNLPLASRLCVSNCSFGDTIAFDNDGGGGGEAQLFDLVMEAQIVTHVPKPPPPASSKKHHHQQRRITPPHQQIQSQFTSSYDLKQRRHEPHVNVDILLRRRASDGSQEPQSDDLVVAENGYIQKIVIRTVIRSERRQGSGAAAGKTNEQTMVRTTILFDPPLPGAVETFDMLDEEAEKSRFLDAIRLDDTDSSSNAIDIDANADHHNPDADDEHEEEEEAQVHSLQIPKTTTTTTTSQEANAQGRHNHSQLTAEEAINHNNETTCINAAEKNENEEEQERVEAANLCRLVSVNRETGEMQIEWSADVDEPSDNTQMNEEEETNVESTSQLVAAFEPECKQENDDDDDDAIEELLDEIARVISLMMANRENESHTKPLDVENDEMDTSTHTAVANDQSILLAREEDNNDLNEVESTPTLFPSNVQNECRVASGEHILSPQNSDENNNVLSSALLTQPADNFTSSVEQQQQQQHLTLCEYSEETCSATESFDGETGERTPPPSPQVSQETDQSNVFAHIELNSVPMPDQNEQQPPQSIMSTERDEEKLLNDAELATILVESVEERHEQPSDLEVSFANKITSIPSEENEDNIEQLNVVEDDKGEEEKSDDYFAKFVRLANSEAASAFVQHEQLQQSSALTVAEDSTAIPASSSSSSISLEQSNVVMAAAAAAEEVPSAHVPTVQSIHTENVDGQIELAPSNNQKEIDITSTLLAEVSERAGDFTLATTTTETTQPSDSEFDRETGEHVYSSSAERSTNGDDDMSDDVHIAQVVDVSDSIAPTEMHVSLFASSNVETLNDENSHETSSSDCIDKQHVDETTTNHLIDMDKTLNSTPHDNRTTIDVDAQCSATEETVEGLNIQEELPQAASLSTESHVSSMDDDDSLRTIQHSTSECVDGAGGEECIFLQEETALSSIDENTDEDEDELKNMVDLPSPYASHLGQSESPSAEKSEVILIHRQHDNDLNTTHSAESSTSDEFQDTVRAKSTTIAELSTSEADMSNEQTEPVSVISNTTNGLFGEINEQEVDQLFEPADECYATANIDETHAEQCDTLVNTAEEVSEMVNVDEFQESFESSQQASPTLPSELEQKVVEDANSKSVEIAVPENPPENDTHIHRSSNDWQHSESFEQCKQSSVGENSQTVDLTSHLRSDAVKMEKQNEESEENEDSHLRNEQTTDRSTEPADECYHTTSAEQTMLNEPIQFANEIVNLANVQGNIQLEDSLPILPGEIEQVNKSETPSATVEQQTVELRVQQSSLGNENQECMMVPHVIQDDRLRVNEVSLIEDIDMNVAQIIETVNVHTSSNDRLHAESIEWFAEQLPSSQSVQVKMDGSIEQPVCQDTDSNNTTQLEAEDATQKKNENIHDFSYECQNLESIESFEESTVDDENNEENDLTSEAGTEQLLEEQNVQISTLESFDEPGEDSDAATLNKSASEMNKQSEESVNAVTNDTLNELNLDKLLVDQSGNCHDSTVALIETSEKEANEMINLASVPDESERHGQQSHSSEVVVSSENEREDTVKSARITELKDEKENEESINNSSACNHPFEQLTVVKTVQNNETDHQSLEEQQMSIFAFEPFGESQETVQMKNDSAIFDDMAKEFLNEITMSEPKVDQASVGLADDCNATTNVEQSKLNESMEYRDETYAEQCDIESRQQALSSPTLSNEVEKTDTLVQDADTKSSIKAELENPRENDDHTHSSANDITQHSEPIEQFEQSTLISGTRAEQSSEELSSEHLVETSQQTNDTALHDNVAHKSTSIQEIPLSELHESTRVADQVHRLSSSPISQHTVEAEPTRSGSLEQLVDQVVDCLSIDVACVETATASACSSAPSTDIGFVCCSSSHLATDGASNNSMLTSITSLGGARSNDFTSSDDNDDDDDDDDDVHSLIDFNGKMSALNEPEHIDDEAADTQRAISNVIEFLYDLAVLPDNAQHEQHSTSVEIGTDTNERKIDSHSKALLPLLLLGDIKKTADNIGQLNHQTRQDATKIATDTPPIVSITNLIGICDESGWGKKQQEATSIVLKAPDACTMMMTTMSSTREEENAKEKEKEMEMEMQPEAVDIISAHTRDDMISCSVVGGGVAVVKHANERESNYESCDEATASDTAQNLTTCPSCTKRTNVLDDPPGVVVVDGGGVCCSCQNVDAEAEPIRAHKQAFNEIKLIENNVITAADDDEDDDTKANKRRKTSSIGSSNEHANTDCIIRNVNFSPNENKNPLSLIATNNNNNKSRNRSRSSSSSNNSSSSSSNNNTSRAKNNHNRTRNKNNKSERSSSSSSKSDNNNTNTNNSDASEDDDGCCECGEERTERETVALISSKTSVVEDVGNHTALVGVVLQQQQQEKQQTKTNYSAEEPAFEFEFACSQDKPLPLTLDNTNTCTDAAYSASAFLLSATQDTNNDELHSETTPEPNMSSPETLVAREHLAVAVANPRIESNDDDQQTGTCDSKELHSTTTTSSVEEQQRSHFSLADERNISHANVSQSHDARNNNSEISNSTEMSTSIQQSATFSCEQVEADLHEKQHISSIDPTGLEAFHDNRSLEEIMETDQFICQRQSETNEAEGEERATYDESSATTATRAEQVVMVVDYLNNNSFNSEEEAKRIVVVDEQSSQMMEIEGEAKAGAASRRVVAFDDKQPGAFSSPSTTSLSATHSAFSSSSSSSSFFMSSYAPCQPGQGEDGTRNDHCALDEGAFPLLDTNDKHNTTTIAKAKVVQRPTFRVFNALSSIYNSLFKLTSSQSSPTPSSSSSSPPTQTDDETDNADEAATKRRTSRLASLRTANHRVFTRLVDTDPHTTESEDNLSAHEIASANTFILDMFTQASLADVSNNDESERIDEHMRRLSIFPTARTTGAVLSDEQQQLLFHFTDLVSTQDLRHLKPQFDDDGTFASPRLEYSRFELLTNARFFELLSHVERSGSAFFYLNNSKRELITGVEKKNAIRKRSLPSNLYGYALISIGALSLFTLTFAKR